jgi:hypothetical protein
MKLTSIYPEWQGQTVAILASGPSMTQQMADAVRGVCRVIAINDQAIDYAPWADVIYGSDQRWWAERWDMVKDLPGRRIGLANSYFPQEVECLRRSTERYDERPDYLAGGGSSGYAALGLAVKLGATRVELYGYDMRKVGGKFRRKEYPANLNSKSRFAHWLPTFVALAPLLHRRGVSVINCTPGSALCCFPFAEEVAEVKSA